MVATFQNVAEICGLQPLVSILIKSSPQDIIKPWGFKEETTLRKKKIAKNSSYFKDLFFPFLFGTSRTVPK